MHARTLSFGCCSFGLLWIIRPDFHVVRRSVVVRGASFGLFRYLVRHVGLVVRVGGGSSVWWFGGSGGFRWVRWRGGVVRASWLGVGGMFVKPFAVVVAVSV